MRFTPTTLGLVVRTGRKDASLTQDELAQRVKVSRKWISGIENGKADVNLSLVVDVLAELGYELKIERGLEYQEWKN